MDPCARNDADGGAGGHHRAGRACRSRGRRRLGNCCQHKKGERHDCPRNHRNRHGKQAVYLCPDAGQQQSRCACPTDLLEAAPCQGRRGSFPAVFHGCGRGGTGRRATLRSLWAKARGSSSLLDRTIFPKTDARQARGSMNRAVSCRVKSFVSRTVSVYAGTIANDPGAAP